MKTEKWSIRDDGGLGLMVRGGPSTVLDIGGGEINLYFVSLSLCFSPNSQAKYLYE